LGKKLNAAMPGRIAQTPLIPKNWTTACRNVGWRVGLDGRVQPVWETRGGRYTWAIPSPDGKYLAVRAPAMERNARMIANF
jgi:hypothetical protein